MGYHVTTPYIYKPKPPAGHGQTDGQGQGNPAIIHQAPVDPPVPFPTVQQPVEAHSFTERQLPGESCAITDVINNRDIKINNFFLLNQLQIQCAYFIGQ